MKYFSKLIREQQNEVRELTDIARSITSEKLDAIPKIEGVLLTGSVARGDARIGPYGVMIDLALIVENKNDINLDDIFGKDEEPHIPYHCVTVKGNIGLQIEVVEKARLFKIREKPESAIFAMNESVIISDRESVLTKWKRECFIITDAQIKSRALNNYFRFCYLTGEYRLEKWMSREAFIQIAQIFNEAAECYCNFLYCINRMFIPRKDWLTYLTFELANKPEKHNFYMEQLYTSYPDANFIIQKSETMRDIQKWLERYCLDKNWL